MKRFVGRTKNAVLSQLWVATCMYLLLAYLKFVLRLSWSRAHSRFPGHALTPTGVMAIRCKQFHLPDL